MLGGTIFNNTAMAGGGVFNFATFNMRGGAIFGNRSNGYGGGGVYTNPDFGTFRISNGIIYGIDAEDGLGNMDVFGAALWGTALYGVFEGNLFIPSGSVSDTDLTVEVVDGVLIRPEVPVTFAVSFDANSADGTSPVPGVAEYGRSIRLPDRGLLFRNDFAFGGWNTEPDGTGETFGAGDYFTVTGNVTLYAVWVPATAVTVTVTGISDLHVGRRVEMTLRSPGGGGADASAFGNRTDDSAVFELLLELPGTHIVYLAFELAADDWLFYRADSRNITAGANTVPFYAFTPVVPQVTVTVTGIPERYADWRGEIYLATPGVSNVVAWDRVETTGSSATFSMPAMPGTYNIYLFFEAEIAEVWKYSGYAVHSRNILAGANTIPFGAFAGFAFFSEDLEPRGRSFGVWYTPLE